MVDRNKIGRATRKEENPKLRKQMKLKEGISNNQEKNRFLAAFPMRINWNKSCIL